MSVGQVGLVSIPYLNRYRRKKKGGLNKHTTIMIATTLVATGSPALVMLLSKLPTMPAMTGSDMIRKRRAKRKT